MRGEAGESTPFENPCEIALPRNRASFLISIDTEMAWGQVHRGSPVGYHWPEERSVLRDLLAVFDSHDIPATWAIVGHLFLDSCQRVDGVAHPGIVRPEYAWRAEDWFVDDPCTTAHQASSWYAPDLVAEIAAAPGDHEIASHGFSHMLVREGCSAASFESELRACKTVASEFGIDLRSFVYPRNEVGHVELLRQHGFVAYRGPRRHPLVAKRPGGRVRQQADRVLLGAGSVVCPVNEDGLWNFPATALFPTEGQRGRVMLQDWQLRRRMDQAVEHGELFHLWFHPHNLRSEPVRSLRRLDRLCARAARLRDAGELETHTFGSLADRLTTTPLPDRPTS